MVIELHHAALWGSGFSTRIGNWFLLSRWSCLHMSYTTKLKYFDLLHCFFLRLRQLKDTFFYIYMYSLSMYRNFLVIQRYNNNIKHWSFSAYRITLNIWLISFQIKNQTIKTLLSIHILSRNCKTCCHRDK